MRNKAKNPVTDNVGTGADSQSQEVIVMVNMRELFFDSFLEAFAKVKGWTAEYLSEHFSEISPIDPDLIAVAKSFGECNDDIYTIKDIEENYSNHNPHLISLPKGTRFILSWYNSEDSYYSGEHIVLLDNIKIHIA